MLSANGSFTFATAVPNGSPYSVTVLTQPAPGTPPQLCNVVSGSGTMPASNVTTVQAYCGTTCLSIHQASPSLGNGNQTIDPDGTGPIASFQAYCDMGYSGGGWTLVQSTNGGICAPGSETAGLVAEGSCAYVPTSSVKAVALLGNSIHVRTAVGTSSSPTTHADSATAIPIDNLRNGNILNLGVPLNDAAAQASHWTLTNLPSNATTFSCPVNGNWPNVYWGCGNTAGWHLYTTQSTWNYSQSNGAMEVFVR